MLWIFPSSTKNRKREPKKNSQTLTLQNGFFSSTEKLSNAIFSKLLSRKNSNGPLCRVPKGVCCR